MENLITRIKALGTGAATLILAIALVSLGALSWTDVHAEIETTPHNLAGASLTPGPNNLPGTADICVFCHTPHGGTSVNDASVPLWNRDVVGSTYQTYALINSATIEGAIAPVGSVSIACLSCHDGAQAMDALLNDPGSGTVSFPAAPTWNGADRPQGIANIGTDLSNDHPIGIQYGGGGVTTANLIGADPDFAPVLNDNLNGTEVWWVDVDGGGTRDKNDMLLYTRTDFVGSPLEGEPSVECASCHDPHTATPLFLRTPNDGSAVCLACHTK